MIFSFRKAACVARQEVWTVVATKGFIVMLVVPLLFFFLMSVLFPLAEKFMKKSKTNRTVPVRVVVVGSDPGFVEEWRSKIQDKKLANGLPLFELHPAPILGASLEALLKAEQKQVREGKFDAIAALQGDLSAEGRCEFYYMRGFNIELPDDLRWPLEEIIRERRLKNAGFDPAVIQSLSRGVTWNEYEIPPEPVVGEKEGEKHKASFDKLVGPAIVAVMIMFFLVFTTSQRMLRGIVEEKTSRVVEILLSSVSPIELLAGKVFGFYLIGMIQFVVWVSVGVAAMIFKEIPINEYVQPDYFLEFFIFLSTGYLFYASCFAAIGAMVSDETESQGVQGIITFFIVLPLMFNIVFITQPMWLPVRLLSFIPFMSPTIMAIRLIAGQIPWWEIAAVAVSSMIFSMLATFLAARIFRIGILLTGKRPSPRELWRWCFYRDSTGVIDA